MWPNGEWVAGLAATAAVLVAAALGLSAGFVDPVALALVTGATAIALGAALLPPGRSQGGSSTAAVFVLALGLVIGVAHHLVFTPRIAVAAARTPAFQVAVATCAAVLATYAWTSAPRSVRLARFVVLTALLAVIGALVILAAPVPRIDVWHLQQGGALELAAGNNPYAASYPNIYGPRTRFIDPSLLNADGRRITAFPYTPLTLLLDVPGAIVGDVRWSLLAAVLASAWLIRALGRGSTASELAAILVLLQPQGFWVVERAWTEPFSLVTILVAALLIARARGWVMPAAALGVAAASKQYMPLLVTPLWLTVPADRRWPALGVAGVSVAALMLPFLAWHPAGFVRGLVEYQVLQPFRPDALSWPALAVQLGGPVLASWAAFVFAAALRAVAAQRSPTPGQAFLAGAASWTAFVLFSKQAFCNYYWLSVGLLCAAASLVSAPPRRAD